MSRPAPTLEQAFSYMDELRASGRINMLAAPQEVADFYDIPLRDARVLFTKWSASFSRTRTLAERVEAAEQVGGAN